MARLAKEQGLSLIGSDGLLKQFSKTVLETALNEETGQVANRPTCAAIGVSVDGSRDVLGLWAGTGGEAQFICKRTHWIVDNSPWDDCFVTSPIERGSEVRTAAA